MIAQVELDAVSVISLSGYIDADTAPLLSQRLTNLRSDGHRQFVVDCSAVTYISSHGVWTVLKHTLELRQEGGDIRLAAVTESVAMIIQDLRIEKHLSLYPTVAAAVASFD